MTTLFVADIHLSAQRPDLIKAFVSFIENTAAGIEALYLLGDIFEAWIGDDFTPPELLTVINALKTLSESGTKLFFQRGNRDFLVGEKFTQHIGAKLLNDSLIVELATEQALIMHGDQLCIDDVEYQKFRSVIRSNQWRDEFLKKPVSERLQIAEHLRNQSKQHSSQKSQQITDVNPTEVVDVIKNSQVNLLIHGHTHRPFIHDITISPGTSAKRIVLGDWDKSLWYIRSDEQGCQLIEENISVPNQ